MTTPGGAGSAQATAVLLALRARGIEAGYDGHVVLRGVDVAVPAGRIVGLYGPSAGGKTTLGRVMAGLLRPSAGEVLIDGARINARRGRLSSRVAMVFQSPRRSCSPRLTLAQIIAEPLTVRTRRAGHRRVDGHTHTDRTLDHAVHDLAAEVGLTPDLLTRLPAQVSDGQLQRAALARALAQDPAYLICDEATAMLDAVTTAVIAALVRRRAELGLGVLAISHDTALLTAWADEVTSLEATQAGAPESGVSGAIRRG